ncbi:MAG: hypothetical protein LBL79_07780 [Prevotella sp.]|jgi:hypothetical protein|nr:hypothetical protein [Prevotella sp.]
MAKKKAPVEEILDAAPIDETGAGQIQEDTELKGGTGEDGVQPDIIPDQPDIASQAPDNTGSLQDWDESSPQKEVVENELPEMAKKILQQYSNEKELYIDGQGGVFAKGTHPALIEHAILYKNPYYKK